MITRKYRTKLIRVHPEFMETIEQTRRIMKEKFSYHRFENPDITKLFSDELRKNFFPKLKKLDKMFE